MELNAQNVITSLIWGKRIFIGKIPSNDIRAGRKIVLKKNKEIESEQFDLVEIQRVTRIIIEEIF